MFGQDGGGRRRPPQQKRDSLGVFQELGMDEDGLRALGRLKYMESRIPALDALVTFVPDGAGPDPAIEQAVKRLGHARWYPVEGGHRVVILYEGGPYDATRFVVEQAAWDHDHCVACEEPIPSMTLCWVSLGERYVILCESCHRGVTAAAKE
jgi:hypothetical protein